MNHSPMSRNSYTLAPEDDPKFRTGLTLFAGVVVANALYLTYRALPGVKAHPARLSLVACVAADALLMAICAYLFKTRRRAKIAGYAILCVAVFPTLTAQAIGRTGQALRPWDVPLVLAPFLLLYILSLVRSEMRHGRM